MSWGNGLSRGPLSEATSGNQSTGYDRGANLDSWRACVRHPSMQSSVSLSSSKSSTRSFGADIRGWLSGRKAFKSSSLNRELVPGPAARDIAIGNFFPDYASSVQRSPLKLKHNEIYRATQPSRAILLAVPSAMSLIAVLSQVCGGPLERVMVCSFTARSAVIIEFMYLKDAQNFLRYATLSPIVVSGRKIACSYVTLAQNSPTALPSSSPRSFCANAVERMRRVLRLYRYYYGDGSDEEELNVDPLTVKAIFGGISPILQLQPMLCSNAISYAIHYDSVKGACQVKSLFDTRTPAFERFRFWRLEYLDDPTERPCIML